VIANPISDLRSLGEGGYLRLVPFGDIGLLSQALRTLREQPASARAMVEAGRRLYLRQFSYAATRVNFALAIASAQRFGGAQPAAQRFARFFRRFQAAHGLRARV
jgi:hypothetical protein